MTLNEIITLTNAGWSKDEILNLVHGEAQDPQEQVDQQPQPDPQPVPEQPAVQPEDDRLTKLETKLDYVINRFNYLAVQNSQQPAQQQESVDDILASVVRGFSNDDK